MSQLKSSGNLRLIRNKTITDSLATYWNGLDLLNNVVFPAYDITRIEVKNISFSLFNFDYYKDNIPFFSLLNDNVSPKLLSSDKREFIKLANFISYIRWQSNVPIRQRIMNARRQATDLILVIRKNYHIK